MIKRWIAYALALIFAIFFHSTYVERASYYLFFAVLMFPILSFVTGLPILFGVKIRHSSLAYEYIVGDQAEMIFSIKTPVLLPSSRIKMRYRVTNVTFGHSIEEIIVLDGHGNGTDFRISIPTRYVGRICVECLTIEAYDYSGLFKRTLVSPEPRLIVVRPQAQKPIPLPDMPKGELTTSFMRPKPGGGFAEDYDLRQYRQGDPMNSVHWKLSVKLDDLIVRESLVSDKGEFIVAINLSGDEKDIEFIFGVLTWLNYYFNDLMLTYKIVWMRGNSLCTVSINCIEKFADFVSGCFNERIPLQAQSVLPEHFKSANWLYYIHKPVKEGENV